MRTLSILLLSLVVASGADHRGSWSAEPYTKQGCVYNDPDARELFEDGQARLRAGHYGRASVTFATLIAVYPESCLVKQARQAMRSADQQAALQEPVVRSIRYRTDAHLPVSAIRERFREREVGLCVQTRYDPRDLEYAKTVLTELLIEKGVKQPRVSAEVKPAGPRSVIVAFTAGK